MFLLLLILLLNDHFHCAIIKKRFIKQFLAHQRLKFLKWGKYFIACVEKDGFNSNLLHMIYVLVVLFVFDSVSRFDVMFMLIESSFFNKNFGQ